MGLGGDRKGVMKYLLFSFIILSALIISVGSVGAAEVAVVSFCTPGNTQPCGSGSCAGIQTCLPDGSAWGACSTSGNGCGSCIQSGCHIDPFWETLDYWTSGVKTCNAGGICSSSTCNYLSVCSDFDLYDGAPEIPDYISVSGCTATCDQDSDCKNKCVGSIYHYNGFCNSVGCLCNYISQNCDALDGNYCNGNVAEQRDYSCGVNGCTYIVSQSHECNDGNVCNGQETCSAGVGCVSGTPLSCNNGLFCDGTEICNVQTGCQSGIAPNCVDSVDCTQDSCNENTDKCDYTPNNAPCQNGLFCDGTEICNVQTGCQSGISVDCSKNNLNPFSICDYNPDNNPITLDIFLGFTSICSENTDSCTIYNKWDFLTHTCSQTCNAACDEDSDCTDKCVGEVLYNGGICSLLPACSCSWKNSKDCNIDDCKNGIQCVVNGNTMYEEGNDYSCVTEDGARCGILGKKQCGATWTCNQQCVVQECGGQTYTCYNQNWVAQLPKENCGDGVDNDCDGLVDCADPDCMDSTKPETTKTYGTPLVEAVTGGYPKWITSDTPITLNAIDPQGTERECVSGVADIFYKVSLVDDRYCASPEGCQEALGLTKAYDAASPKLMGSFTFTIKEDSCHLIEYYSVDKKGNTELTKRQCVFVDNLAPLTEKVVGEVKTKWHPNAEPDDYETSYFYPEETKHCWDGTGEEIECWKVTLDTPIDIVCSDDAQPHPVGFDKLCFKMGWDAADVTSDYCSLYLKEGYSMKDNGYCCGTADISGFKFKEESEHNLEYYCEDKLGNKEYDDEKFKVFGKMYEIDLNKKWNLISVPFDPLNKEPEAVFNEVSENIDSVWSYDAEMNQWKVYRPDAPPETNNLDEIKTGLGYWVMALNKDVLKIGGSLFAPGNIVPATVKIVKGWNLIGHYGTGSKEVYCSLLSLVDTQQGFPRWSSLWGYDNPSQTFIPLDFLLESTHPGKGYWMEIDVNESYSPSSGCVHPNA